MKLFKKIIFGLLLIAMATNTYSQIKFANTWYSSGDHAVGQFIEMPDSSFYLVGYTGPQFNNSNLYKGLLMHVDKNGDTIWTRTYDTTDFTGIAPFNDSTFMVSGAIYYSNTTLPHYCIAKMNLTGDTIWKKNYAYPVFTCPSYSGYMNQCSDGGYVTFSNEACDYGIFKIDSAGNLQWHHPHNMYEACLQIKPDPYGGYVSVGGGGGGIDTYEVARLDSGGNEIWHRSYGNNTGGIQYLYAWDVCVMPDSNYLIGCGGYDWQLMKLDRITGDTVWTKFVSSSVPYPNWIKTIDYAGNNRYVSANLDLLLFDGNGDTIWRKPQPFSPWNIAPIQIRKTLDGGFAYCGYVEYPSPPRRLVIFVKTDSLGNSVFTSVYDPENNFQPLTFYPNPAQNQLYISSVAFANEQQIIFTLHDLQGREILQQPYDKSKPVDLSIVPNGIYIAALKGKEKEVRGKVIVQR